MGIFHVTLRMQALVQCPFCFKSTGEMDPEMAFLACGTVCPLNQQAFFTLTCCLFSQSMNVANMSKNPVTNQDTIVHSGKRENSTAVLTLWL